MIHQRMGEEDALEEAAVEEVCSLLHSSAGFRDTW